MLIIEREPKYAGEKHGLTYEDHADHAWFLEEAQDRIRYGKILSDRRFDCEDGCWRIVTVAYEMAIWNITMHNGQFVGCAYIH